ncbi:hypothetical protein [Floricoccus penangensis]|uniref:hypothetical protein n=1 Tax=Floricoccus penangensis TaxID=1859475 RepID=UPI0020418699|nr:hypothetical protein [Floricoccus penangensis]URZ87201.1 hypothetical protein KIW23_08975 [Floricoccus penangensis]
MEGNVMISLTKDQLVELLLEAKREAQQKFEQEQHSPFWKSKQELRSEFGWGNDTLNKLLYEGMPYIKEGQAYIFVKSSIYEFLASREKCKL